MKYIASLALLATVLFSTSHAALDLCRGPFDDYDYENNNFYFPNGPKAVNEVCLDFKGEVKVDLERGAAKVIFLAQKVIDGRNIERQWPVDLYGAMKLPSEENRPIRVGFNDVIRVCSWLPSEFQYVEKSSITFGVRITRPGSKADKCIICVKGELKLL
ncbi:hypothetical protein BGZ97_008347 [Linnemannia gamsii]|uniref:Uncharacterized protein n=1 Tax=Linnemannia gamsii TaxID=64522 RepID=A0A9P6RK84_9FUNG|nr:hypothetical protein BGZ97_008347 [Linnemannia gamsii]